MPQVRFSAAEREELSDSRLKLLSAAHNLAAALQGGDDIQDALGNALQAAEQAAVTLRRLQDVRQ